MKRPCPVFINLQLNRKVKILESDLEQTEDTLDEKRAYDYYLLCEK